jgi:hypothetical protein
LARVKQLRVITHDHEYQAATHDGTVHAYVAHDQTIFITATAGDARFRGASLTGAQLDALIDALTKMRRHIP